MSTGRDQSAGAGLVPLLGTLQSLIEAAAERGAAKALAQIPSQSTPLADRWLGASDVADLISVTAPTARQLLQNAGIVPVKFGNVLRYSGRLVGDYLASRAVETTVGLEGTTRGRVTRLVMPAAAGPNASSGKRRRRA